MCGANAPSTRLLPFHYQPQEFTGVKRGARQLPRYCLTVTERTGEVNKGLSVGAAEFEQNPLASSGRGLHQGNLQYKGDFLRNSVCSLP